MRDVVVYALVDPRDGATRYVGRSVNPGARLSGHMTEARWGHWSALNGGTVVLREKDEWIRELAAAGLYPDLLVLETVKGVIASALAEQAWIEGCLEMGEPLFNVRDAWGRPLEVAHAA